MPALQSGAAATGPNEWDKEIVDVASYVHGFNVNSDLAVRFYVLRVLGKLF